MIVWLRCSGHDQHLDAARTNGGLQSKKLAKLLQDRVESLSDATELWLETRGGVAEQGQLVGSS